MFYKKTKNTYFLNINLFGTTHYNLFAIIIKHRNQEIKINLF